MMGNINGCPVSVQSAARRTGRLPLGLTLSSRRTVVPGCFRFSSHALTARSRAPEGNQTRIYEVLVFLVTRSREL